MVHYTGWTTDGKMFDSSVARNQPATFGVSKVIPGFSEGIQLMVTGEKRRLWIPEALAYKGQAGRPAGMLVFDVELLSMPNRAPAEVNQHGHRPLHGLDYRRQDVRQFGGPRRADIISTRRCDQRMDRRPS